MLEIPRTNNQVFKTVVITGAHDHREGDEVFAIGNPLGLERSVSRGIVSTRNRNFSGLAYIQMTAQINPGNSGGPLFNSGRGDRVTNRGIPAGEGLGFAIPSVYVNTSWTTTTRGPLTRKTPNTGFRYQDAPVARIRTRPKPGAAAK
ncbi:MAG: hypothetical protein CM1200mP2_13990 [Planctomycetaceae bacterium]|nr:MAG: hypothetical protein CM1200mP2_13990 [Planctomycetaceae bacterium]